MGGWRVVGAAIRIRSMGDGGAAGPFAAMADPTHQDGRSGHLL